MSECSDYDWLITLWTTGRREYHRLTATYVTANSLLIASISFLMKDVSKSEFLVLFISCIGLLLCLNMKVAQSRLSGENYYWERNLRIFEHKKRRNGEGDGEEVPLSYNLFSDLKKLMNEKNFKLEKEYGEEIMYRNYGMVHHKNFFTRRMKLYPTLFGIVYGLFITYLIVKLFLTWGLLSKPFGICTFALLALIELVISYILQPERAEKLSTLEKKEVQGSG